MDADGGDLPDDSGLSPLADGAHPARYVVFAHRSGEKAGHARGLLQDPQPDLHLQFGVPDRSGTPPGKTFVAGAGPRDRAVTDRAVATRGGSFRGKIWRRIPPVSRADVVLNRRQESGMLRLRESPGRQCLKPALRRGARTTGTSTGVASAGMLLALAGLQCFKLFRRHERLHLLVQVLVNLFDPLAPLLVAERRIRTDAADLGMGFLFEGLSLLNDVSRNACFLRAGLMTSWAAPLRRRKILRRHQNGAESHEEA